MRPTNFGFITAKYAGESEGPYIPAIPVELNPSRRPGRARDLLYDTVYHYMSSIGEGHHEDALRAFLRLHVRDLGSLLPHVDELVHRASSTLNGNSAEVVDQATQIVLVCPTILLLLWPRQMFLTVPCFIDYTPMCA